MVQQYSARLPPELLEFIFVSLHPPAKWDDGSNRRDLKSCALVCREWAQVAHSHIFAAISLQLLPTTKPNIEAERTLSMLRDFLESTASVCDHVQTLKLIYRPRDIASAAEVVKSDTLHAVFRLLPHLRRVILDGLPSVYPPAVRDSPPTRLAIDYLEVHPSIESHATIQSFLEVANMFSEVRNLSVEGYTLFNNQPVEPPLAMSARVTSLIIRLTYATGIPQILEGLDTTDLTSLHIKPSCLRSGVTELLEAALGARLTHFGMDISEVAGK